MNEIMKIETPAQSLVPTSMSEALELANLMSNAKLVPVALQKSPADCLMVIMQAIRWQMDVFAVAQECSVIQGKLMHSGKLVAAVINARGGLAERLSFAYEGAGDNRKIKVSGRVQGEVEPRTVEVTLRDVKTQNKVWQTQPDQQLMYSGSRVWARRHAPELMLGVYSPEEFDEVPLRSRAPSPPKANVMIPFDAEAGEVIEHDALDEVLDAANTETNAAAPAPAPVARVPMPPMMQRAAAPAPVRDVSVTQAGAGEETESERLARLDKALGIAATKGTKVLQAEWKTLSNSDQASLEVAKNTRYKITARAVDAASGVTD